MKKVIFSLIGFCVLFGGIGVVSAVNYSNRIVLSVPAWGGIAYETDITKGIKKETNSEYGTISTLSYAVTLKPRGAIINVGKKVVTDWVTLNVDKISNPKFNPAVKSGGTYYSAGRSNNIEPTGGTTIVYKFSADDARN